MNKRLFVGNIKWSVDKEHLASVFSQFGTVISAEIILDRETGRSRGLGFIEMSTEEEARIALESANGLDVDGRTINVNEANPERSNGSVSFDPQATHGMSVSQAIADFIFKAKTGEKFGLTKGEKHFTIIRDDEPANGNRNG